MDKSKLSPIGKKYNLLTVINQEPSDNYGHKMWRCQCECGKETIVPTRQLGRNVSCGCARVKGLTGVNITGLGDITGTLITNMRGGAKRRSIPFSVTAEYLWNLYNDQGKKCAISGLPIHFGEQGKLRKGRNASLDRIDSSKGYIEGNVHWVDRRVNVMKQEMTMDEFLSLIDTIQEFNMEPNPKQSRNIPVKDA